ncbi:MAG: SDR family oxidoreductase [Hyphomicrobiaceae bacterium]|nr:SDR family oxidoreductase [Hyphomicrobiaceae bacterium]
MTVAVITGGSRGIGRECALLLAARGHDIAFSYRAEKAAADALAAEIEALGRRVFAQACDVRDEAAVIAFFDGVDAALGRPGIVLVNAGIVAPQARLADYSAERMRSVFETNIFGAFVTAREAVRRMAKSRGGAGGAIVINSSKASVLGAPGEYIDYAATKGAMDTLTIGLAKEVAGEGIRVNAVRPGIIDTDIHTLGGEPRRADRLGPTIPIGRSGTAREVAQTMVWLASDEASYVTGALVDVAGGR